jgi:hypothetical protein
MASLTDLFNPTFLMFLGILVLVVALLVVYFESKFREQNHKISSMLSLVSSLAEELNGTKMVIQHLSMRGGVHQQNFQQEQTFSNFNDLEENVTEQNTNNTNKTNNIKLIQVSDDEEDSDSESEISDNTSESNDSIEILDDDEEDSVKEMDDESVSSENNVIEIGEHNDIKILKLNITKQNDDESANSDEEQNLDFDDLDDLENLSESSDSVSIKDEPQFEEVTEINETKDDNIKSMDLKSINITLEETKHESLDYKKMALPKLRSVVTEKGLTSDASKLKKNELLKLLGIE